MEYVCLVNLAQNRLKSASRAGLSQNRWNLLNGQPVTESVESNGRVGLSHFRWIRLSRVCHKIGGISLNGQPVTESVESNGRVGLSHFRWIRLSRVCHKIGGISLNGQPVTESVESAGRAGLSHFRWIRQSRVCHRIGGNHRSHPPVTFSVEPFVEGLSQVRLGPPLGILHVCLRQPARPGEKLGDLGSKFSKLPQDLARRTRPDDAPRLQHRDPVGAASRQLDVVCHQQDRLTLSPPAS